MLGLLGLRIFEATSSDIEGLGQEHGHRVNDAVIDFAEVIIVEHLRVALAQLVPVAKRDAELLANVGATPDPRAIVAAGDEVQAAFLRMDEHARRYGAVRTGRGILARLGLRAQRDEQERFSELQRPQDLYEVKLYRHSTTRP